MDLQITYRLRESNLESKGEMLKRRQVRMLIAESLLTEAVNPKIRKQLSRLMSFNHLGVVIKKGNTNVIFEYGLISPEGYHEVIPKRRKTSAPLTDYLRMMGRIIES